MQLRKNTVSSRLSGEVESGPHWEEPGVSLVCIFWCVSCLSLLHFLSVSYLSLICLMSVSCLSLVCLSVCQLCGHSRGTHLLH